MVLKNKSFQTQLQKIVLRNFNQLKSEDPDYSLRAYAKKIGISVTAASEIINGKRLISVKTASKILQNLEINETERNKINRLAVGTKAIHTVPENFINLDAKQYGIISDWYYFAILSLAETAEYDGTSHWISHRLNISIDQAAQALANLEKLDIFRKDDQGISRPSDICFKMAMDRNIFTQGHAANLDLAKKHISTNFALSDYSSMTMAIDCDLIPEAKELILNFRRQLTRFLESGTKKEVYKLNIQLFPLTLGEAEDPNFVLGVAQPSQD